MNNFKNMKIEVTVDQPLEDIVGELERLNFRAWCSENINNGFVVTNKKGLYTTSHVDVWDSEIFTTLAELKEM